MLHDAPTASPLEPPANVPEIQRGDWFDLPPDDPVIEYLTANVWEGFEPPRSWQAARLSRAASVYRETSTPWAAVAKFYAVKTSPPEMGV